MVTATLPKEVKELLTKVLSKMDTVFEWECLFHYVKDNGKTMHLSDDIFKQASLVIAREQEKAGGKLAGTTPVQIDGKQYYSKCISFYGDNAFDYVFGVSTVYFDAEGNPVGFYDVYDFDPAPQKKRGGKEEELVEQMDLLAKSGIGKPYKILYGIHPADL